MTRRTRPLLLPTVLVLLGAGTGGYLPSIPAGTVREGRLSFDGRATTGSFTGTTTAVRGAMTGGASLADVRGWVEAPVRTLQTGNAKRDKDLNRSMESGIYPTIRFELTGCTPAEATGDRTEVTLAGRFTIHGVTREASIPVTLEIGPGTIQVRGSVPLDLRDYRIGGLSRMLGMLRMDETILVHVD
ncbi:MAG TPA: YceI family protein, partial [Gemmatimonadales bacterium]|nr:YceI family protein [Gemmatimonadales bacterium]